MKRSVKIGIMILLMASSTMVLISGSLLKGFALAILAIIGIYVLEKRQVNRTLAYFEPLLLRCGRLTYVEEGITLLKDTLVFKKRFTQQMIYIETALQNSKKRYEDALNISQPYAQNKKNDYHHQLKIERQYASLKLGDIVEVNQLPVGHKEKLVYALFLMETNEDADAINVLLTLREEETGNMIFKEVNALLAILYQRCGSEEAAYYQVIAESFDEEQEI